MPVIFIPAHKIETLSTFGNFDTMSFWFKNSSVLEYCEVLLVTINCNMDFEDFPFDIQECLLDFRSWDSTANEVILNQPRFLLDSQDPEKESSKKRNKTELEIYYLNYNVNLKSYNNQTWDHLGYPIYEASIKIKLERNTAGIPWTFYVTTSTFSWMSLFSFFLDPSVVRLLIYFYEINLI